MSDTIASRLAAVRGEMASVGIQAFIVPRADEYLGEYVPAHNERLHWISGFTGSAGGVIVLEKSAAIFTDGRYTVQVRQQVSDKLFEFESLTDTPLADYLAHHLVAGDKVGVDARLHHMAWFEATKHTLAKSGIDLIALKQNPIDLHWRNRPELPSTPIMLYSAAQSGQSSLHKRQQIGAEIAKAGAELALITALDSLAWLLNIRGRDVPHLPVVMGTGLLWVNGTMRFFTDMSKLPQSIDAQVGEGVSFYPEEDLAEMFSELKGQKLLADPHTANAALLLAAGHAGAELIPGMDPVLMPKACKNEVELDGMRTCHVRDGAAVCRFLAWLDREVATGNLYDEGELADKLARFREQDGHYIEPSFDTISAAGANAAMCHYNHLNGKAAKLTMDSMYLVDSGGQYLDGTTDVTRTIAIGDVGAEQKKMVTLVLKGHIALDMAKFPKGTTGPQLDAFARQYLWQYGFDYDHGTGHGVGHFLSVHEGPQRIAKNANSVPLLPGMILSNEPGYYRTDGFGIRLENLVEVRACEALADAEREMLEFNAITLIPFDLRLLDKSLMTRDEIDWLNRYHKRVYQAVSPLLHEHDLAWLKHATRAI